MKRYTVLAVAALMAACSNDTAGPTGLAIPQQAVTVNTATGVGFVGKGDVQVALGFNNDKMQKAAHSLNFSSSQAGTQDGSQTGTQSSSQSVSQTLVCTNTTGNDNSPNRIVITRAGSRDATRSATRSGIRSGTRTGAIASAVDYDPRKKTQVNGFWLTGFKGNTTFTASGDFTAAGDYAFGDYSWGNYSWGGWVIDENASNGTTDGNLSACANHEPNAYDTIVETVDEGPVVEGAVVDGAWVAGAFTATGLFSLYVNNILLGSY